MNWRWLYLDYVDPTLDLTSEERQEIWRQSRKIAQRERIARNSGALTIGPKTVLVVALLLPVAVIFLLAAFMVLTGNRSFWWAIPMLVIDMFVIWVCVAHLGKAIWHRHIIVALREAGHDVCGLCGYSLQGLPIEADRCPECGSLRDAPVNETCRSCGYWLRGLSDDAKRCPECGASREAIEASNAAGGES